MPDTIVFLQLEHGTIVRLLRIVESLQFEIQNDQPPRYYLLRLLLAYFSDYPDACHHPKEDLVFRALQRRHGDVAAKLQDLLGDHEAIDALTRRTAALVDKADQNDGPEVRKELGDGLAEFVREYLRHVRMEEENFFPAARQNLTRDDWATIDFSVFEQTDPLYDESKESKFRELRDLILDEAAPPSGATPRDDHGADPSGDS